VTVATSLLVADQIPVARLLEEDLDSLCVLLAAALVGFSLLYGTSMLVASRRCRTGCGAPPAGTRASSSSSCRA
jgi:hypothetical protein